MVFPVTNIPAVIRDIDPASRSIHAPLWDFAVGEFQMSEDGKIIESIDSSETFGQLVQMMLITRRGVFPIYDFEFGTDVFELIGQLSDFVLARINRVIRESLNDERVINITISVVSQEDNALVLDIRVIDSRGSIVFDQALNFIG